VDAKPPINADWAEKSLHYRSPELFHELVAALDKLKSHKRFDMFRAATVMLPRKMIAAFGKENVFIARNEDMMPAMVAKGGGFLDQLSQFTGLDRGGFQDSSIKTVHNCNDNKGNQASCNKETTHSAYAIAGNRTVLPKTRKLIYLFFAAECRLWKNEFGIEYPDCLNALSEQI
jgi:hypothetical protein